MVIGRSSVWLLVVGFCVTMFLPSQPVFARHEYLVTQDQEVTSKQKTALRRIKREIDKAGRLYSSKNYGSSAKSIRSAMEKMQQLTGGEPSAELLALVLPEYERMAKAHQLLTEKKEELPELIELPEPPSGKQVSFKTDVAPILVSRCGRCHVNRNRGNFSAATFRALAASTMVSPKMAAQSRIVEVIEDGDMPPGGSLEKEELDTIKSWINQGANFDGDNPDQNLGQLVGNAGGNANRNRQRPRLMRATGKETISFGKDVAPILMESCGQCHIETNRPRGNFSMADFARFLRGGDSGSPVQPGNAMDSLILKRMTGTGGNVMPPSGKLDNKLIGVIEKWIEEGARFDGEAPNTPIRNVAATALANSQSHEELMAARKSLFARNWKLIMSDVEPSKVSSSNLITMGDVDQQRLKDVSKIAESAIKGIQKELKIRSQGAPFIKGNSAVYVLERRYDLTELGTMLAKKNFPKEVKGHWDYTIVDSYASVLLSRNRDVEEAGLPLTQQLTALYVSSLAGDVPRWFADGVGHVVTARIHSKDERIKSLDENAEKISQGMEKPDDFIRGRLPDHEAGLVGYLFVKQLKSGKQLNRMLKLMQQGNSFMSSFEQVTGRKLLPDPPRRRRRQR